MERILKEVKRLYGNDPEDLKDCLIEYTTNFHSGNLNRYFEYLSQICKHCNKPHERGDLNGLFDRIDYERLKEIVEYMLNNETGYKVTDILYYVLKHKEINVIHYFYEKYFMYLNIPVVDLLRSCEDNRGMAVLLFCGGIEMKDIPQEHIKRIKDYCGTDKAQ